MPGIASSRSKQIHRLTLPLAYEALYHLDRPSSEFFDHSPDAAILTSNCPCRRCCGGWCMRDFTGFSPEKGNRTRGCDRLKGRVGLILVFSILACQWSRRDMEALSHTLGLARVFGLLEAIERLLPFLRALLLIAAGTATLAPEAFGRLRAIAVVLDTVIRSSHLAPQMRFTGSCQAISPSLVLSRPLVQELSSGLLSQCGKPLHWTRDVKVIELGLVRKSCGSTMPILH